MSADKFSELVFLRRISVWIEKKPTWSEWSPWGNCSQTCDGGERIRYRTCQNDISKCQQQLTCQGSDKQIEPCNTEKCRK